MKLSILIHLLYMYNTQIKKFTVHITLVYEVGEHRERLFHIVVAP